MYNCDWEQRELKDILKWSKGNKLAKNVLNEFGKGAPVVHYADLYKFSPVVNEVIHWSESNEGTIIPDNSLLFPMSDVTPVGLARTSTITKSGVMAGGDTLIGTVDRNSNAQFVSYQVNANYHKIIPLVTGTTVRHVSSKAMGTLKIFITSLREQEKIGTFFKKLDDAIALHQRELEELKKFKQGFLQKMVPKNGESVPEIRFPGFTEDWQQRKWFDTVNMSTDMVDPKTGKYDNLPHIGPGNIESFSGRILDNVKSVREDNLISGKFHFKTGDIIYGKINPQLAKYAYINFEGLASADTYILKSHNGISQDFLFVLLQTKDFYKYSISVSMRTGMPKINRDELGQYNYLAPMNIKEQKKIGTFFKQLDDTIALHQKKIKTLQELKSSLLNSLFL